MESELFFFEDLKVCGPAKKSFTNQPLTAGGIGEGCRQALGKTIESLVKGNEEKRTGRE